MPRVALIEFWEENTRKAKSLCEEQNHRRRRLLLGSFLTIVILGVGLNAKSWMVYQPQPSPSSDSSPSPTDRFPGITSPETPSNNQNLEIEDMFAS
uniref:Uncharacterized protein n=1 Tax=Brassica campestris TaxID=3711 RepID=M4DK31_BRACM